LDEDINIAIRPMIATNATAEQEDGDVAKSFRRAMYLAK